MRQINATERFWEDLKYIAIISPQTHGKIVAI